MLSTRTLRILALAGSFFAFACAIGSAAEKPPTASLPGPDALRRVPVDSKPRGGSSSQESSGGWWLGSVGIVAALAVFGGVSVASKRFLPTRDSGPIQVVGRSSLSPKHSVYLLRVGDRVLIVGAGPQGAPSTLGEVTDPAELARLVPRKTARVAPTAPARSFPTTGFDQRIGDDE